MSDISSVSNDDEKSQAALSEAEESSLASSVSGSGDPEFDGDELDPIAICGFSIKFPQDATSPDAFWKMLVEKRCAMTHFPADRMNLDGFHQKRNRMNTVRTNTPCHVGLTSSWAKLVTAERGPFCEG